MFPAFLTTLLFSLSAVTGPRTAKYFGSVEGNFWRFCLAASVLGLYAHTRGQGIAESGFTILFISGCIGFGGDIALFQAYHRLGSRLAILIVQCLAAPFAAITEWVWLGNALSDREMICGFVILAGVGMALAPGEGLKIDRRTLIAGIGFGLLAAYCQGFGAGVLSRKAYEVVDASGGRIDGITAAYNRLLGGILVTALFVVFVRRREIAERLSGWPTPVAGKAKTRPDKWRKGWKWMVVNGLAGPGFGVSCYQWALLHKSTGVVLPIVALTPLVVIPMARLVEGEKPSARSILGGVVAVVGAVGLTMTTE